MTKNFLKSTCFLFIGAISYCRKHFQYHPGLQHFLLSGFFFLLAVSAFSQDSRVNASLDTLAIKIGDQVIYTITVETDPSYLVVFPEDESFNPMEVVESLAADTSRLET